MIYTMEYEVAHAASTSRRDDVPGPEGLSWTELHRAGEIIRAGELAAEEALPRLKALIPSFRP